MENLSLILWRERELFETLLFKLEVEQLVLAGGRTRWLSHSAREVERVLAAIRETELLRSVAADEVARALGLPPNPSLRALAEGVEEPWRSILREHRDAFVAHTQEIMELASANRDLLTSGYQAARDTLMSIGGAADHDTTDSYAPDGSAAVLAGRRRLLDRSI